MDEKVLNMSKNIFVIDDHNISGGLGDLMNSFIQKNKIGHFNFSQNRSRKISSLWNN